MTTHTTQGVAGRLGYALGMVVRAIWFSQNRTLRWVKRLALIALAVFFSTALFNWIISVLLGVVSVAFLMLIFAKPNNEDVDSGKKTQSIWDRNSQKSLWHHEDEIRKWQ